VESLNVGTGQLFAVLLASKRIVQHCRTASEISITRAFRQGDIRHNFADLAKVGAATGFAPRFSFCEGLAQFLDWAAAQDGLPAGYESSLREMSERGLLHG